MINRRVLIVDDSLTVRMDLSEVFEDSGFEVVLSASLEAARAEFAAREFDLLILDLVLPDGDGLGLLAEIRRKKETESLPVLLLSTKAEVADRLSGLWRGADDYVGKPYSAAKILERAKQLTERGRQRTLVLVVDDSLTYREQLGEALEAAGFQPLLAENGGDGLEKAAQAAPAAAIVDGLMPDMHGSEVIRRLRLDPGLRALPCLLLTGTTGAASEIEALEAGADAFVRKDQSVERVIARLRALLRTASETTRRLPGAALGPERILAIDDSVTYLGALSDRLRQEGYDVVMARGGEEALALLANQPVHAILLDLIMPGLSGIDTCRRVKSRPATRDIPLIFMTAHDGPTAMVDGLEAGADDYVAKDANLEVLVARLRAQLRRRRFEEEHRQIHAELLSKEAETRAAQEVAAAKAKLLEQLEAKNALLEASARELKFLNSELERFAYSVSHDLRQPLRTLEGFSRVLVERSGDVLDEKGRHYLGRIRKGAQRMGVMIDGLLRLSQVTRVELNAAPVRLDLLASEVALALRDGEPDRKVEVVIEEDLACAGDPALLECLLENLLGNAWKFTANTSQARIEVGSHTAETGELVFHVRDNGAGFDMRYAEKLFGPFQRLHSAQEFEGTGVGLATVQRIVHRHGGRVWADSFPNEGATFCFTLTPRR